VRRAVLLLLLLLAVAGCGGDEEASSTQPEPTAGVEELENVLALRADFEADAGKTRVLLLFSPT
jgi:ABC-type glycerol-3-phosphate transport system substrate-binding protein